MSSTRALKAKIIRQIRLLQQDLAAIERVEAIERRQVVAGSRPEGQATDDEKGKTLIGAVEGVLKDDWEASSVYVGLVQAARPDASRAAISTALQRLVARGFAESRGDRVSGFEYRKMKTAP